MSQSSPQQQTHISFQGNRRSLTGGGGVFRNRLWLGPALTAILLLGVGWWTNRSVESAVKQNLADQLETLLNADVAALQFWLARQRASSLNLAEDDRVRQPVEELVRLGRASETKSLAADLLNSDALSEIRDQLDGWLDKNLADGFLVIDNQATVLGHNLDIAIGDREIVKPFMPVLEPVFDGETITLPPIKSVLPLPDEEGRVRAGLPMMFIAAPVADANGEVIAALCLRIRPEEEFTEILRVARAGETGETYAFNDKGVMITNSRFDDELKLLGLLPDDEETASLLNIQIRDPGINMTTGARPTLHRKDQPFTRMAEAAIGRKSGADVDGYRDYRGVPVVGAWTWLDDYNIGVATEVDVAEAFRPLYALRLAFGGLALLLLAITVGLFGLTYYASRLELKARKAALQAKRLGQYALGDELGAGGMGVVYRAHHDMLHRPTAVKLLHAEKTNEQTIARFEREVQLTSQLTHPNTIAIYDYGRTPEGVFYYAMEFLDGLTLEDMVDRFGPLSDARAIFLLRQLCGSLAEAHGLGLIHRDIKPANIMLTRYGGMCDFVKLLDFGLVKPRDEDRNMTMAGSLTGTPLYLSPEAIRHDDLDQRSDIYAIGAVGYFMLVGEPVFNAQSIVDICQHHLETEPEPLSKRAGRPVDPDLERLILSCLAKSKEQRPASAVWLEEQLGQAAAAGEWSRSLSTAWWSKHLSDSPGSETQVGDDTLLQTMIAPPSSRPGRPDSGTE